VLVRQRQAAGILMRPIREHMFGGGGDIIFISLTGTVQGLA
jgi:hypothetical protein